MMKTEIKKESLLRLEGLDYDYTDSFDYIIADPHDKVGISEIAGAFIQRGPGWFEALMTLRNKIVSIFKLKTPATVAGEEMTATFEPGKRAGVFKVFRKSETEIILGGDDRHLDFRVSLFLERNGDNVCEKRVTVTTAVKRHNLLGKLYFFFVKPVHRTVVPLLLKRYFKRLESTVNQ